MELCNKSESKKNLSEAKNLEAVLLGETLAFPEKFSIFPYECISLIWLDETIETPTRGNHTKLKIKSKRKERYI